MRCAAKFSPAREFAGFDVRRAEVVADDRVIELRAAGENVHGGVGVLGPCVSGDVRFGDDAATEVTKHAILSYPLPDQQSGEKFAAFTYLHSDAQNQICGTVHNVASAEMLEASGSSGVQFDERARERCGSEG